MKSLKNTKAESRDSGGAKVAATEPAAYPCGTRITLDADSIKKLGIQKMPAVGSQIMFEAKAEVVGISQSGDGKRIELQIVAMDMGAGGGKDKTDNELTREDSGSMSRLSKAIKGM
ncbi:MAG: capsid staple protein [Beijerinckiaceae bacterium]